MSSVRSLAIGICAILCAVLVLVGGLCLLSPQASAETTTSPYENEDSWITGPIPTRTTTTKAVLRGDFDGNKIINTEDAIYLLRNTMSPSTYPITQSGDVDGNKAVNSNDAVYLLRYTLSPSEYPLSK